MASGGIRCFGLRCFAFGCVARRRREPSELGEGGCRRNPDKTLDAPVSSVSATVRRSAGMPLPVGNGGIHQSPRRKNSVGSRPASNVFPPNVLVASQGWPAWCRRWRRWGPAAQRLGDHGGRSPAAIGERRHVDVVERDLQFRGGDPAGGRCCLATPAQPRPADRPGERLRRLGERRARAVPGAAQALPPRPARANDRPRFEPTRYVRARD